MSAHILIWSLAKFSGNRFITAVEWIPLLFYGIGITELVTELLSQKFGFPKDVLLNEEGIPDSLLPSLTSKKAKTGNFISVTILFIGLGLAPTVLEDRIPTRYTEERLTLRMNELALLLDSDRTNNSCLENLYQAERGDFLYGQALYPRFLELGEVDADRRDGRVPEPYGSRVDFYLVGETSTWASLPQEDQNMPLNNTDEVILLGDWVKNTYDKVPENNKFYYHIACMFIFGNEGDQFDPRVLPCSGPNCLLD
jgi:hypothetical protein